MNCSRIGGPCPSCHVSHPGYTCEEWRNEQQRQVKEALEEIRERMPKKPEPLTAGRSEGEEG